MWAAAARMDPARDTVIIERTPIDYLDFASPDPGLGGQIGFDATNKVPPETTREWGRRLRMSDDVIDTVTPDWARYGLPGIGKPIRGRRGGGRAVCMEEHMQLHGSAVELRFDLRRKVEIFPRVSGQARSKCDCVEAATGGRAHDSARPRRPNRTEENVCANGGRPHRTG